jgi:sorting nexin-29
MENNKSHVKVQSDVSAVVTSRNVLRHCDALVCLLFNITLEKILRVADVRTDGIIFFKSVQSLTYADDTDNISRSQPSLKEAFLALEGGI